MHSITYMGAHMSTWAYMHIHKCILMQMHTHVHVHTHTLITEDSRVMWAHSVENLITYMNDALGSIPNITHS